MRLTNHLKDGIINGVMRDLPAGIDYRAQAEELVRNYALSLLPPDVQAFHKKYPQWLNTNWVSMGRSLGTLNVPCPDSFDLIKTPVWGKLKPLREKNEQQISKVNNLRRELRSAIYPFATKARLLAAFPEFAKYFPEPTKAAPAKLPVAVSEVRQHLKKAGWPAKTKSAKE